jgi:hypothetical protein
MDETFGNYEDISQTRAQNQEHLTLSFSPSSIPIKQRWRNNGLSADFLGDYFTTFFPKSEDDPASMRRQIEVKAAVSYIANELLENAMKFSDEVLNHMISIRLMLDRDRIIFSETNGVSREQADSFRDFINKIMNADPNELYIQQLEENAMTDSSAGLGYLTMINDYGAELAWHFEDLGDEGVAVTTEIKVAV